MRKTNKAEVGATKLLVNTEELQAMLSCGRGTALKIGDLSEARVEIGRRVLWNVRKVQEHLDDIAY